MVWGAGGGGDINFLGDSVCVCYRSLMAPWVTMSEHLRIETIRFSGVLFSSNASLCFFILTYNLSCNLYRCVKHAVNSAGAPHIRRQLLGT